MTTLIVKSITTVQVPGKGWTVRIRTTDGQAFFDPSNAPYTLAQAETAINNSAIRSGKEFVPDSNGGFL